VEMSIRAGSLDEFNEVWVIPIMTDTCFKHKVRILQRIFFPILYCTKRRREKERKKKRENSLANSYTLIHVPLSPSKPYVV